LTKFKLFNPWVDYSGLVTWVPEVRIHTKCIIKVKDFPFDTQCCEINLYSWAHTAEQMVILQYGNKNVTNSTSDLPVIGVYYTFNIFLVAFLLAGAVFILRLHFRGHKKNRVPKWIRILFGIFINF